MSARHVKSDSAVSRDRSGFARTALAVATSLGVVLGACGGTSGALPDAGVDLVNAQLTILDPPGDILGLGRGTSVTLRVRYETEELAPIASADLEFQLVGTNEGGTGGATLSGSSATTDATGVARMSLLAGADDASFSIRVTAPNAQPVTFVANVSSGGFADVLITPVHSGWRDSSSFDRVEVRLYRASDVRCDTLNVDAPPESLFPPRSMASFDGVAEFRNVRAEAAYTVVAWGIGGASAKNLAAGCVDIAPTQLPASPAKLFISVADREAAASAGAILESAFDVSVLVTALEQAGLERWWTVLACPAGPGQLVLDCALDALGDDGVLDCVVGASNATIAAIEARRGAVVDGCRPAVMPDSSATADALLTDAIDTSSFPTGTGLEALLTGRSNTLDLLTTRSELRFAAGNVSHRLVSASFDISGTTYTIPLGPTARPILVARNVPATMSLSDGLVLGEHGFTLRFGSLAMAAFRDVSLASAGLDASAHTLGTAMVDSVTEGGMTGCGAVSKVVCSAAGLGTGCLATACETATPTIDAGLDAWWRHLDGPALDFGLSGAGALLDAEDDLVIDGIGVDLAGTRTGLWSAEIGLANSESVITNGAFGSITLISGLE